MRRRHEEISFVLGEIVTPTAFVDRVDELQQVVRDVGERRVQTASRRRALGHRISSLLLGSQPLFDGRLSPGQQAACHQPGTNSEHHLLGRDR